MLQQGSGDLTDSDSAIWGVRGVVCSYLVWHYYLGAISLVRASAFLMDSVVLKSNSTACRSLYGQRVMVGN